MISLEILLPFFFTFAIVYGALEVSGVFGKRPSLLIALVIAFFSITSPELTEFLNEILPLAVIFFILFFFLGFVIKFVKLGGEKDVSLIIVLITLLLIFLISYESEIMWVGDKNLFVLAGIILIILLFYGAYKISE